MLSQGGCWGFELRFDLVLGQQDLFSTAPQTAVINYSALPTQRVTLIDTSI